MSDKGAERIPAVFLPRVSLLRLSMNQDSGFNLGQRRTTSRTVTWAWPMGIWIL